MNTIKPAKEFFRYIIRELACEPAECFMVWDSITNDIVCARDIGMAVCYYNSKGKEIPEGISVDYEIRNIKELLAIL